MRHVRCENREISYLLEQKPVKNRISEFIKMAVYFFPPIPMFPLQRSMRLFWAKPPISLPHRISLLKLLDILPSPNSMSVEKPSIFWGVVCAWKLLLPQKKPYIRMAFICFWTSKHHRLQQKATVGYPILGPSMWSDFWRSFRSGLPIFSKIRCGKTSASYPFHGHSLGFLSSKKADHYTE